MIKFLAAVGALSLVCLAGASYITYKAYNAEWMTW
jgi:hypothetical protein